MLYFYTQEGQSVSQSVSQSGHVAARLQDRQLGLAWRGKDLGGDHRHHGTVAVWPQLEVPGP